MINAFIRNKIEQIIESLDDNYINSIYVLKGIPLGIIDTDANTNVNLVDAVNNKLLYLFNNIQNRAVITYEEFLLLKDILLSQYENVIILNNNIFMNQYPIDEIFDTSIKEGLLSHFLDTDNEKDDDLFIGNINEYINLYTGMKQYNGYLLGVYNDENVSFSNKVHEVNLFDLCDGHVSVIKETENDIIDLQDENDYICLVKKVLGGTEEVVVSFSNYIGNKEVLRKRIEMLSYYFNDWVDLYIYNYKDISNEFISRVEYTNILKQYWGHSSFRNIDVYDIEKLEEGEKILKQISQEQIIADVVNQVENCYTNNMFSDIFVTAPTGAGKSVMFQIPAIYLAEKYNLLTIVISPLIGLMNDQVRNLEVRNYTKARTINSDISPILKEEIVEKVSEGEYHILYISPETLLSRSDVEQLIGNREIGMIVIDEAHIVTTWGKQFRPDYWYLGDHIRKLRTKQIKEKQKSFLVATFTATAIYRGIEDMYLETVNSLHMINPTTYLGHVKRSDIDIRIEKKVNTRNSRSEYEIDKFDDIIRVITRAKITNKKTLVYFPTVALINRCYDYLYGKNLIQDVTKYHGSLEKDEKELNYNLFYNKEKLVMLATKAFGMGIDINDIEIVVHFAPTGNVCDYVQEIGRGARKKELKGEAYYKYDSRDFKHINRLHGLSTIKEYQLLEVVKKIDDLYKINLQNKAGNFSRRRNAMLLDADNFTYIFGNPINDESDNINKVKTALLIIQKDFENKYGFSPIAVRPIPMFSFGFFKIDKIIQSKLLYEYPECLEEIEERRNICRVNLSKIWNKGFSNYSFPMFKYLIYSKNMELIFNKHYPMEMALSVSIMLNNDYDAVFKNTWDLVKRLIFSYIVKNEFIAIDKIVNDMQCTLKYNKYKLKSIVEVLLSSMDMYRLKFSNALTPLNNKKTTNRGEITYQFNNSVNAYFKWVENGYSTIVKSINQEGKMYIVNDATNKPREISAILGILESINVLKFEMIGGANSQIYIYINQIQALKNIIASPSRYENRLLTTVSNRHTISVKMLSYIYEGNFESNQIWEILENYFLGIIPDEVKDNCLNENPTMDFD